MKRSALYRISNSISSGNRGKGVGKVTRATYVGLLLLPCYVPGVASIIMCWFILLSNSIECDLSTFGLLRFPRPPPANLSIRPPDSPLSIPKGPAPRNLIGALHAFCCSGCGVIDWPHTLTDTAATGCHDNTLTATIIATVR